MLQTIQRLQSPSISEVRLELPLLCFLLIRIIKGTLIDVFGTINAPGIYGCPNASFTITPLNTGVPLQHLNETGYVTEVLDQTIATSHLQFFKSGNLPLANHTLTITADGAYEGGPTFYLDFLRIAIPSNGTYDSMIVDDNDLQWVYTSNWIKGSHVGEYLDTWHATPIEGGTAQLSFYGTSLSLYGALSGSYDPDTPLAYINIDSEPAHTITVHNITDQPLTEDTTLRNQLIFSTQGLPDLGATTPRTLTISIPFVAEPTSPRPTISAPSWFVDYAIYGPYTAAPTLQPSATTLPPFTASFASAAAQTSGVDGPSTNGGLIAGAIIGTLAAISIIFATVMMWLRRKWQHPTLMATARYASKGSGSETQPFVLDISRESPYSGVSFWDEDVGGGVAGYGSKTSRRSDVSSPGRSRSPSGSSPGYLTSTAGHTHRQTHSRSRSRSQGGSPGYVSTSVGHTGAQRHTHSRSRSGQGSFSTPRGTAQEADGGIRLATSTTYESEILPPTYAPYDR